MKWLGKVFGVGMCRVAIFIIKKVKRSGFLLGIVAKI
jgi:hypothetical protein